MVARGAVDLGLACPHGDIHQNVSWDDGRSVVRTRACDGRLHNLKTRAGVAVTIEGRAYSVDDVKACRRDLPFYEESGGGVTLSGGEALMQHRFAFELLRRLAAEGIHTAIETSGHVASGIFRAALSRLD
jgi:pyruvate-formate lyase-activating enzyme